MSLLVLFGFLGAVWSDGHHRIGQVDVGGILMVIAAIGIAAVGVGNLTGGIGPTVVCGSIALLSAAFFFAAFRVAVIRSSTSAPSVH